MGRNLSTLFISQSYQFLTQISGSELQDGLGNTITGSLAITSSQAISSSFATTASFALNAGTTVSTASLLTTASAANNVITFTKGDSSQFTVTVATGSAVTVNTGSLLVTASISNATTTFTKGDGSTFSLTANNVVNATSSSYASTSSKVSINDDNGNTDHKVTFVNTTVASGGDQLLIDPTATQFTYNPSTNLLTVTSSYANFAVSSSNSATSISSSYSSVALSSSFATSAQTATSSSFATSAASATSASFATTAATASYYNEADTLQTVTTRGNSTSTSITASGFYSNGTITTQNAVVLGTASIAFLDVTYQSSSVIYSSGSNQFGDASNDVQTLFGTVDIKTGPLKVTGSADFQGGLTGSLLGTASFATTASFALSTPQIDTGSFVTTASIVNATTTFAKGNGSTFSLTVDNVTNATSASYALFATGAGAANSATSASYAVSASFAPSSPAFPYTGSAIITGSLQVSGTLSTTPLLTAGATNNIGRIVFETGYDPGPMAYRDYLYSTTSDFSIGLSGYKEIMRMFTNELSVNVPFRASTTATFQGNTTLGNDLSDVTNVTGSLNVTGSVKIKGTITSGDYGNTATGVSSAVIGGGAGGVNTVTGQDSTIAGGHINTININNGFVGGGRNCRITAGDRSGIVGGFDNLISNGDAPFIGGGGANWITGNYSGILAGAANTVGGNYNATVGGNTNTIGAYTNTVIVGGTGITAAASNTVYVPNLVITGSITGSLVITGSVRGNVNALSISSNTASLDCSSNNFFTLQLVNGANTFVNPTNIAPGQTINLRVNTTGSGTISFPSSVKQVSGSSYTPSAGTAVDIVTFISFDASSLFLSNVKNLV